MKLKTMAKTQINLPYFEEFREVRRFVQAGTNLWERRLLAH
jgi:hypothetical protein